MARPYICSKGLFLLERTRNSMYALFFKIVTSRSFVAEFIKLSIINIIFNDTLILRHCNALKKQKFLEKDLYQLMRPSKHLKISISFLMKRI